MTNAEIRAIVEREVENMRSTIRPTYTKYKTGIYVFFKSEYDGPYCKEYAQIGGYMFHRIQKPEYVIKTLRNDKRLYD